MKIMLTFLLFSFVYFLGLYENPKNSRTVGYVSGKVFDLDGTPISDASITLFNNNKKYEGKTDSKGFFYLKVPSGNYTLRAWKSTFYESYRSNFKVKPNSKIFFDINLIFYELIEIRKYGMKGKLSKTCIITDPVTIKKISNKAEQKTVQDILIQFGKEIPVKSKKRYSRIGVSYGNCKRIEEELLTGNFSNDRFLQVVTTYGDKTIYSDSVVYDNNNQSLTFEGNVSIQTGKERVKINTAILNMAGVQDKLRY